MAKPDYQTAEEMLGDFDWRSLFRRIGAWLAKFLAFWLLFAVAYTVTANDLPERPGLSFALATIMLLLFLMLRALLRIRDAAEHSFTRIREISEGVQNYDVNSKP